MDQMELHRHLISVLDEQTRKLEQKIAQMGGASKVSDDIRFKLAIVRDSLRRVHAVQEQLEARFLLAEARVRRDQATRELGPQE